MRTCKRLNIRTIAVYSDADRDAVHTRYADEAIRIGPAAARDSYLRADAIMEAATRSGADAIHPGYGFLSEKTDLPLLCETEGRIFVGPSAACIAAMGPKIGSKLIAAKAGVPSVPGYAGDDQSDARLVDEAHRIGFPIMVKASAGGGGKGMRRVFSAAELLPALDLARREAQAAFGDAALLLETLVLRPRHLEVQIAGDKHGNIVHLFERDCSVQRNNQKVLEEAPAPNLPQTIRRKLLDRGVALARAIGYDNLGTVEFILEEGKDEPWFLEMNTRLQVEHPVTEAITGFDLVEWQIRIAAGETLPATQEHIKESGHAIEARITAERADDGFRPDAGRITAFRAPKNIRVDSGVAAGSEVTLFYDSLLAKAIGAGETRDVARTNLVAGLRDFTITGPATTIPFLIDALEEPIFAEGRATTRFIEDSFPTGWARPRRHQRLAQATAAILATTTSPGASAWTRLAGFRVLATAGGVSAARCLVTMDGIATPIRVCALPGGWRQVHDADGEQKILVRTLPDSLEIETDGRVIRGTAVRTAEKIDLDLAGETYVISVIAEVQEAATASDAKAGSGAIMAAMPGVIAEVKVAIGDTVAAGDIVLVLESMKLFMSLPAAIAGRVMDIACRPGETVSAGKRLMVIEPEAIA